MARPRKNAGQRQKSLPIPAEIPVEEQPYALPQGWKWVYLRTGYEITSSKRIHKSDWRESGIPFYRTRELVKLSKYGYVDNELFIDKALYENPPISIKEGYLIKEGYNSELDELKSSRKGNKDFVSKLEQEERDRTGIKTLKVGYN